MRETLYETPRKMINLEPIQGGIKIHIGIDLDNTILDATTTHLHYFNIASGLTKTPDDVNDFYMYRFMGGVGKKGIKCLINTQSIFIGTRCLIHMRWMHWLIYIVRMKSHLLQQDQCFAKI
jgi:hypothetical protein